MSQSCTISRQSNKLFLWFFFSTRQLKRQFEKTFESITWMNPSYMLRSDNVLLLLQALCEVNCSTRAIQWAKKKTRKRARGMINKFIFSNRIDLTVSAGPLSVLNILFLPRDKFQNSKCSLAKGPRQLAVRSIPPYRTRFYVLSSLFLCQRVEDCKGSVMLDCTGSMTKAPMIFSVYYIVMLD